MNAYRELGEFDAALAYLRALPLASLDVSVKPCDDRQCEQERAVDDIDKPDTASKRRLWLAYFRLLEKVIARRDVSSEPIDLIPMQAAVHRCAELAKSGAGHPLCASGEVVAEIERQKAIEAELDAARKKGGA